MSINFLDRLKNRIAEVAEENLEAAKHLLVPDEVEKERMAICKSCEYLFEPTQQCKKCGCVVKLKTKFSPFSCPINKWGKYIPIKKQE